MGTEKMDPEQLKALYQEFKDKYRELFKDNREYPYWSAEGTAIRYLRKIGYKTGDIADEDEIKRKLISGIDKIWYEVDADYYLTVARVIGALRPTEIKEVYEVDLDVKPSARA